MAIIYYLIQAPQPRQTWFARQNGWYMAGFVIFVAVFFLTLRSHNRFLIFIAFFLLFLVTKIFASIIFLLALFDQTGKIFSIRLKKIKFLSNHSARSNSKFIRFDES